MPRSRCSRAATPAPWSPRGSPVRRAPAPFRYRDKGTLATIGRDRAVADIKGLRFSGFLAWATWLFVHIFYLIGFENRIVVMLRWAYSYFTRGRGSRLITEAAQLPPPGSET